MLSKPLTTRVSALAIIAGFTAGCGGSGGTGEEASEADSGLVMRPVPTSVLPPAAPVPTLVVTPAPVPPNASAPLFCSTIDQNPRLPDGTVAALAQTNTWPHSTVPFRFHESVEDGSFARGFLEDAMRHYHFMTSVRFVEDAEESEDDFVVFRSDGTNCANLDGVGYRGGRQELNLSEVNCRSFDIAVHELGHLVGLHHEQRRSDRDQFILIQDGKFHGNILTPDNIVDGTNNDAQFDVYTGPGYQGGTFDFDSVMLYPSMTTDTNFAKDITKPIITRASDNSVYPDPQTGGLSGGDTDTLFHLYPAFQPSTNTDNTCRTAPRRRSTLPTTPGVPVRRSELLEIADHAGTAALSEFPSTGSSFGAPSAWGNAGAFEAHVRWAAGDFDNDGLTDVAEIKDSNQLTRVLVRTASGTGLRAPSTWADRAGEFESSRQWFPGDYSGDGRDDLAVVWRDGDWATLSVLRSNGTGFGEPEHWVGQKFLWDDNGRWTVGDFNDDGRADLASINNDAGFNTVTVRLSTGADFWINRWLVQVGAFDARNRWFAGDFNGDGRSDLAQIRKNGNQAVVEVSLSSGNSFLLPFQWVAFTPGATQPVSSGVFQSAALPPAMPSTTALPATTLSTGTLAVARPIPIGPGSPVPPVIGVDTIDTMRWTVSDFNDDGKSDLVAVWNNGGTNVITVLQSTGASFSVANWSTSAGAYLGTNQWCAGRFRDPAPGNGVLAP